MGKPLRGDIILCEILTAGRGIDTLGSSGIDIGDRNSKLLAEFQYMQESVLQVCSRFRTDIARLQAHIATQDKNF